MITDPISDMLTRIRNAAAAGHESVVIPYSGIKEKIAAILKQEGFITDLSVSGEKVKKGLVVTLKYNSQKKPVFSELSKTSKLSRRLYVSKDDIKSVRYGRGIAILSTSKGVMKDMDAKKMGLGGEILCTVW